MLSSLRSGPRRALFAPEVVQTSAMDCGPASLKSLLEGFGIPVSYGRLREACQTDVDGTSIDTMEDVAVQLGLRAEQVVVPRDHVLLDEGRCLPALIVTRLPDGRTHFVVVWRRVGGLVAVMDPGTGRQWLSLRGFLDQLYMHEMPVPADAWRGYAGTRAFLGPLRRRLQDLGLSSGAVSEAIQGALGDLEWRGVAALDASTRMVAALLDAGGVRRGDEARRVLAGLVAAQLESMKNPPEGELVPVIPAPYWTVRPLPQEEGAEAHLAMRGAVLVTVRGRLSEALDLGPADPDEEAPPDEEDARPVASAPPLSPELAAALSEPPTRPGRALLALVAEDGAAIPLALAAAVVLGAGGVVVEALLFRAFFEVGASLGLFEQRVAAVGGLLIFVAALLALELPLLSGVLRLGRHLEVRLRVAFLEKIPRLGDRYFQSRPPSDMAERSHAAHAVREVGRFAQGIVQSLAALLLTAAGIVWLDPGAAPLALLALVLSAGLPLLTVPLLTERDMRMRTHAGALTTFYLDALRGLTAIRTHGAEAAVRRQHEGLLTEWTRAGLRLQRLAVALEGVEALAGFGLAAALLLDHVGRHGAAGAALLLLYWALSLPNHGAALARAVQRYPGMRNLTLRLMEPLGAPEEAGLEEPTAASRPGGAAVALRGVRVVASGHVILDGIDLDVTPGEHVAVVGPSGAGKSSLVGLLLGWHRPAEGAVLVDGEPVVGRALAQLRRETAWVDPSVQLWNRSFLDNLRYGGAAGVGAPSLGAALDAADLRDVLERLPDGLQSRLGEGGGLLSGGQGQRVRLGRAALRPGVRLVILDEPFRGLDRDRRRALLDRARARWSDATMLCITHDVGETMRFGRVLVVDGGRVVEDGDPAALAASPDSRYRALLDAEEQVRRGLWEATSWRRLWLAEGAVTEREGDHAK